MRIDNPTTVGDKGIFSGSFSGSFQGDGSGLTNISGIGYAAIIWPSGWISGSSQVIYSDISGIPSDIVSSSVQIKEGLPSGVISSSAQIESIQVNFSSSFQNIVVTQDSLAYFIDGVSKPKLTLQKGHTYRFDLSDSTNAGHPLAFRLRNGSTSYTDGVSQVGTPGSAGAYTQIHVKQDAPTQLIYYCTVHGNGMGNYISIDSNFDSIIEDNLTVSGSIDITGSISSTGILNLTTPAFPGREDLIKAQVDDNSVDRFGLSNGTTTSGRYIPTFYGYTQGAYQGIIFRGLGDASYDNVSTSAAYVDFVCANTNSSTDPNNGTLTAPTTRRPFKWYTAGKDYMSIEANGDLHVDSDIVAYSTTISDKRLKDDVETIDNALTKIQGLRGVSYTWNKGSRKGQKDLGLIAQEVESILPEVVREKKLPLVDEETYKTVDYEKIIGVLIEAVKELSSKVDKLENNNI